jgi:hypothetical protein
MRTNGRHEQGCSVGGGIPNESSISGIRGWKIIVARARVNHFIGFVVDFRENGLNVLLLVGRLAFERVIAGGG